MEHSGSSILNLHRIKVQQASCTVLHKKSLVKPRSVRKLPINLDQELMSGEAAKERATTVYVRVPSKYVSLRSELPNKETHRSIAKERATTGYVRVPSKYVSLRSELPNKETHRSIKHQNDDLEKPVFCNNGARSKAQSSHSLKNPFDLAATVAVWRSNRMKSTARCPESG